MNNNQLSDLLDENWEILEKSKDGKLVPAMRLLANHIENPRSFVTFAGETSSGKSTLINSFLGEKLLPAGAKPTTGTVTWLEYGIAKERRLLAVNRDATIEELTREQFNALSERPDKGLLRLKAEIPETRSGFAGLNVFDTPGFNAIIAEHAEVLKEFLPESDMIVFPVSYKVGFGASDRLLMDLVSDVRKQFGALPVLLVVNRAPESATEDDKRIREIRLNAEDILHDKVQLQIVKSAMPTPDGESVLPKTDELWQTVAKVAFSKERAQALNERFRIMIKSILQQRIDEIDGELAVADLGREATEELLEQKRSFEENEKKCYAIVDKYMDRISRELPKHFTRAAEKLIDKAESEIDSANKWVDAKQCAAYIYGHVLPFGTSGVARDIEAYIKEVFDQMDEELSEMADRAIKRLNDRAQTVENPQLGKLLTNLGIRIGQRVAGELASSAVRSVSGVGGVASGVGNLVKMGVKHLGHLFGKTFSRDVYTNIGKMFTKEAVQTMTVCLQAAVELAFFAWDACHWQDELKGKVRETVDGWKDKVISEIDTSMVADYRKSNYASVEECYKELVAVIDTSIDESRHTYDNDQIKLLKADSEKLAAAKNKLEG